MSVRCGNHERRDTVRHATVAEVRACYDERYALEAEEAYEVSLVYCSLCDGIGHGQPGYGPCPLEMRGDPCSCGNTMSLDGLGCLCGAN